MSGSLTNLLTASQNIVTALNNNASTSLQVAGNKNVTGITAQAVVSANPGRVATVSVIVAGSTTGTIWDAANTASASNARRLAAIPMSVGVYVINMPVAYGIVVTPGTGMTVAVSYS
jgi:hypothetical protein